MDRDVKIPPDWNAEVQINIDRFRFTFETQNDFTIAERIYKRLLELRELYIEASEQDLGAAERVYRLHSELDDLIVRAKAALESWDQQ